MSDYVNNVVYNYDDNRINYTTNVDKILFMQKKVKIAEILTRKVPIPKRRKFSCEVNNKQPILMFHFLGNK